MKFIIGLGNPGVIYKLTKHNVGSIFVSWLANHKLQIEQTGKSSLYSLFTKNDNLCLCISRTFMNQSGRAVNAIIRKYPQLSLDDMIIIHDDLQHKIGNVRIKDGGSAQGHNGVFSIIQQIKSNKFKRLQFGIGRPNSRDSDIVAQYVLTKFQKSDFEVIQKSFQKGVELLKSHNFL